MSNPRDAKDMGVNVIVINLEPGKRSSNEQSNENNTDPSVFFKTRLCKNFEIGRCMRGNQCSYAHGRNELRPPQQDWEKNVMERIASKDDKTIIREMGLCKNFNAGKECRKICQFKHEYLSKYKVPLQSTIAVKNDTADHKVTQDIPPSVGISETKTPSLGLLPVKLTPVRSHAPPLPKAVANGSEAPPSYRVGPRINWIAKEKGLGKISRIYGDWHDVFPPS